MKTHTRRIALLLVLLLTIATASATVEIVENQATLAVDYGSLRDNQGSQNVNGQITVRNTDAADITIQTTFSSLPSGYSLVDTINNRNVTAGSTATIPFTIRVPHHQGEENLTIGSVIISDTTGRELDRTSLVQQTRLMLQIDGLTVKYTDEKDDSRSDDFNRNDETYQLSHNVVPGTEMILTFTLKNLFDRSYDDGNLENLQLSMDFDSNLFTDKTDQFDVDNLDASKEEDFEVKFTVDEDADVDNYDINIELEGEDGQGATYTLRKTLTFEVQRKNNDVRITNVNIVPATITTCDKAATVTVNLKNFGKQDQRQTAIAIFNQKLGLNENIPDLSLDRFTNRNNHLEKSVTLDIDSAAAGTYPLDVFAFIKNDEKIDTEKVNLVIQRCAQETTKNSSSSSSTTTTVAGSSTSTSTGTVPSTAASSSSTRSTSAQTTPITSGTIVDVIENPYSKQDFVMAMMFIAMAIALALIVIFLIILLK